MDDDDRRSNRDDDADEDAGVGAGSDDDRDDEDDSSTSGGAGSGNGLPSRLPEDEAECDSASGVDGCYFAECCSELVACSESSACTTVFGCHATCPEADDSCFASCAGSAFIDGATAYAEAITCTLFASGTCESGATGSSNFDDADGGDADGDDGTPMSSEVGPLGSFQDELGWDLAVSDDPLTAEVEVDADRAVSQEITSDGGTLTATAEDGTEFQLVIPEGAVYGPTVITLTPLSSVDVELEGDTVGVQIEPDGLDLMGSPTLSITPPDDVEWAVEQQVPLAIDGKDDTVALVLVDPESEPLRLALTHFSSYVVLFSEKGIESTLSQAEIRRRFGGDAEARIQSAAAERLGKARLNQLLGTSEESVFELGFADLIAEYEEHVLKPRLALVGESCKAAKLAIRTLLGVERQYQLLGIETSLQNDFVNLIPTVAEVCMREEYEICRDEHVITRVLPTLYGLMRQSQLLGLGMEIEGFTISPPWLIEAEEYARKCLQFELQFDSNVAHADDSGDLSMSETVTGRIQIGLQASLTTLPADALPSGVAPIGALISGGPAPLESSGYSVHTNEECRTIDEENSEDGELYVSFLGFVPGENKPSTPGGSAQITDIGLSLAISPNLSSYDFSQQQIEESGCGPQTATGTETLSWSSTLGSYLLDVTATGDNGAWIDDWKPVNDDIIATKDLTLNYSDGSFTSEGPVHFVLFHAPQ